MVHTSYHEFYPFFLLLGGYSFIGMTVTYDFTRDLRPLPAILSILLLDALHGHPAGNLSHLYLKFEVTLNCDL